MLVLMQLDTQENHLFTYVESSLDENEIMILVTER